RPLAGQESITGLGQATISYFGDVVTPSIELGSGTLMITATGAQPTTVTAAAGGNTINVGAPTATISTLPGIHRPLTGHGRGSAILNINDEGTTTDQDYNIWANHVDWAADGTSPVPTHISCDGLARLVVNGGTGRDTYNVESTAASTPVTISAAAGATINV